MDYKFIEQNIKTLDSALSSREANASWLGSLEEKTEEGWLYILNNEERNKLRSMLGDGGEIYSALFNTRNQWKELLKEELNLKRDFTQQIKLDRTMKANSLFLRILSAFGVIVASVVTLNIATHFGFNVPWIVSRNISATNLPVVTPVETALKSVSTTLVPTQEPKIINAEKK